MTSVAAEASSSALAVPDLDAGRCPQAGMVLRRDHHLRQGDKAKDPADPPFMTAIVNKLTGDVEAPGSIDGGPHHLTRHCPDALCQSRVDAQPVQGRHLEFGCHHSGFVTRPLRAEPVQNAAHRHVLGQ